MSYVVSKSAKEEKHTDICMSSVQFMVLVPTIPCDRATHAMGSVHNVKKSYKTIRYCCNNGKSLAV